MRALASLLSTTANGRWQPGIGDPTFMGWLTVLAYLGAALLALRAARRCARTAGGEPQQRTLSRFWTALALLLLALGINKQLDLQTLLTQVVRDLAFSQGWYERRRKLQVFFIAGVCAVGALSTLGLAIWLRQVVRRVWVAALGVGFLVTFVMVRAASFHNVDLWLHKGWVKGNWVLELTSIALIGWSAWRAH